MCRLGGVVLSNKQRTNEDYTRIAEELLGMLVKMEDALGGDGNSLSFHYADGSYRIMKEHRKVHKLFSRFDEIKKNLKDGAIIVQMHARLSTCGPSSQHDNMHPFVHGPIIGCHNGQVEDTYIWQDLEQYALEPYSTTDSEAIFANFRIYAPSLHPKQVQVALNDLWGTYALSVVSTEKPNQLLLICQDNPLCYYHNRKDKELWYASTSDLFTDELGIPTKKVAKKTVKGKIYYTNELKVEKLNEGDAVYIRSNKRSVSVEEIKFEMQAYNWNSGYYGWGYENFQTQTTVVSKDEALQLHREGADIWIVHEDGTEDYALDLTDIENHEGEFVHEHI